MRYKGKLVEWHDEQGYGFIAPLAAPDDKLIFLHIKSFKQRGPRPLQGCLLEYELAKDAQGRLQAYRVDYVRGGKTVQKTKSTHADKDAWQTWLLVIYVVYLLALAMVGKLPSGLLAVPVIMGTITYLAYFKDKQAAKQGDQRVPENTLHLLALFGGWCGALMAQRQLRHKTVKPEFQRIFWLTVMLNMAAVTAWALWGQSLL